LTRKGIGGKLPVPFSRLFDHCVTIAVSLPNRFFLATILGGRLHPDGVPDWGPWESSRLHWWPEDHLDLVPTTTRSGVNDTVKLTSAMIEN
jgi:hypothetical protein